MLKRRHSESVSDFRGGCLAQHGRGEEILHPRPEGPEKPLRYGRREEQDNAYSGPAERFRKHAERDPWTAENWVIHEMLHTLGLGENPPSSREITQRVNERCQ